MIDHIRLFPVDKKETFCTSKLITQVNVEKRDAMHHQPRVKITTFYKLFLVKLDELDAIYDSPSQTFVIANPIIKEPASTI